MSTSLTMNRTCPNPDCQSRKRNSVIRLISKLKDPQRVPLISTDGYKFYERVIYKCFEKCLYGQVIKTRRNDRVTKVDRRMIIGEKRDFEKALQNSEVSETLNTSFIERLNLTIRQSTSYLTRRTTCFARLEEFLEKACPEPVERAIGHSPMPLQFPQTTPSFEVRAGDSHSSDAGRARQKKIFVPGCVHFPFRGILDQAIGIEPVK